MGNEGDAPQEVPIEEISGYGEDGPLDEAGESGYGPTPDETEDDANG